jgi:hypothetical protein
MNDAAAGAEPLPAKEQLGTLLLRRGLISEEQLQAALAVQRETGAPLGQIVVERGFVRPSIVAQALATQHGSLLKTEYGYATTFSEQTQPVAVPDRVAALEAAVVARDEAIATFNATAEAWQAALEQRDEMIKKLVAERDALAAQLAAQPARKVDATLHLSFEPNGDRYEVFDLPGGGRVVLQITGAEDEPLADDS